MVTCQDRKDLHCFG